MNNSFFCQSLLFTSQSRLLMTVIWKSNTGNYSSFNDIFLSLQTMSRSEDIRFLHGFLNDDNAVISEFMDKHVKPLQWLLRSHFPKIPADELNDIVYESVSAVREKIKSGKLNEDNLTSLSNYYMTVGRNKGLEWTRRVRFTHPEALPEDVSVPNDDLDDEPDDEPVDPIEKIRALLKSLGEICQKIITLRLYKKLSYEDMVNEVEGYRTVDALKTRKYKCIQELKRRAGTAAQFFNWQ